MKINYITALLIMSLIACRTSKKIEENQVELRKKAESEVVKVESLPCAHSATMLLSEDPQCGVILKLPNQLILQPTSIPDAENFRFENGSAVRVTYDIIEDMTSSCTEAFAVANISCLENDFTIQAGRSSQCMDVNDVFAVDWMQKVLSDMDARKVTKALFKEKPIYIFENRSAAVYFNCYGTELCRIRPGEDSNCHEVIAGVSNEYVILVVNN